MSMLCTLSRVTVAQIAAMRADPSVATQLLHDPPAGAPARPGLFARLLGKAPPPPAPRLPWVGAAQQYDLDRQWHILHFLLTGLVEGGDFPASFLCGAGEEIGVDLGYGKPRLFTSDEAGRIAAHLESIEARDLLARYDADAIEADVYWQVTDAEEERREQVRDLHGTMREIAAFAADTARHHCGLAVEIY
jgi:hypothetical protein